MNLPTLWADVGFTPNPAQEQAIRHVDGPLYLPAGPGSGKTRVLLWRAVNLIVFHKVKPDEIFLSTFTEKAALQLKEGLRGLLAVASQHTGQHYDLTGLYVGTVHSLCRRLLLDRRLHPERQRGQVPALRDELSQYLSLEELFPPERAFIRVNSHQGGKRALYDWIQLDSDVEKTFLERLKNDPHVLFFFKFPAAFKVELPKRIGNYNPDWGMVRYDNSTQKATLHLIRETKGGNNLDLLRFPHEKRKIICALKYFEQLGIDYNFTSGQGDWWASRLLQERLGKRT